MSGFDYDVLIIGSGFGGSVSALRLTEKGYRVGVLEAGRRFADTELPQTSWRLRRYLFAPRLGCTGILRMTLLGDVLVLSGAGVGGGSLGYANTLYEPPDAFYEGSHWASLTDWRRELAPYFAQARRMLGVTPNPLVSEADVLLRDTARDLGCGDTFRTTPVGVHFGPAGALPGAEVPDPYFGGAGPARNACTHCGACMTGCRHNAKNTLPKNYLGLAERAGARVLDRRTVTGVERRAGGWAVTSVRTGVLPGRGRQRLTSRHVVFAAGALGTQRLLHTLKDDGGLPDISPRLGRLTRTNSEAVLGVRAPGRDADYSRGVAITSSVQLDDTTHVEPVRYGRGSNLLALLGAMLVDPVPGRSRLRVGLAAMARDVRRLPALHNPRRWSQQTVVLLVMQTLDNSVSTRLRRTRTGRRRLTSRLGEGAPNPTWIPAGHRAARTTAERVGGQACGTWADLFDVPTTGHLIGGCTVGDSPLTGVIDPYHRLHGYPGLHVVDGSTISANLGVNPSLTITALAERAAALWPNKGESDTRPEPGRPYRHVAPVPPRRPAVPTTAPGALRLPPPHGTDAP
ncbi:GMC oxidoreductase [Streptomyces asoensis]|uniref:Cholesterol oxidase n=1 Tax=Streptomyces asoensis TaxID=249586 RepID=C1IC16_9ACTN|nr:GMC family oxidoreductase [Streptomyces asoensis]ABX24481.1 putative cholesterol oxidase [Streptomyces asoensis]GGQ54415.1 cholesterol oxidase [Streptomyces asoensis]GHI60749.1 cholesterol oxidase [Streptomyces asoensis]